MSNFIVPQTGLATPRGFHKLVGKVPPMCDPKAEADRIFSALGKNLDMIHVHHADVWIGKYVRSKIGNIIAPELTKKEDEWTGKVGLVLKYGPRAKEVGLKADVGDWVYFRYSDGLDAYLICANGTDVVKAKLLDAESILGHLDNPDLIW